MKRSTIALLITMVTSVGFGQIAAAADMPAKAPLAPMPSWTGWYVGGNVGYGSSTDNVPFTYDPLFFRTQVLGGITASVLSPQAKGALGGIQAGYNYQMSSTVVGVEADYDFAGIRGSDSFVSALTTTTSERKITSLGTLRARVGYLPWNTLLLYATGGLAYGHTNLNVTVNTVACGIPGCLTATDSGTKAGWTLGGGGEWMFAPKWSVKAEYLYVSLGSRSVTVTSPFGIAGNFYTGTANFRANIVRGGINYHF